MHATENNQPQNAKGVLDYTTINVTLKEVAFRKEGELVTALERILKNNKVDAPSDQEHPTGNSTNYYTIDLTPEQIDKILDILFELEAANVDENGEATPTGSFYATLVDKWTLLS